MKVVIQSSNEVCWGGTDVSILFPIFVILTSLLYLPPQLIYPFSSWGSLDPGLLGEGEPSRLIDAELVVSKAVVHV